MKQILAVLSLVISLTAPVILAAESSFKDAAPGRAFAFPKDHGKHPEFQTEWWYFTGNLRSDKQEYGFQLTFFRRSLVKESVRKGSSWSVRDVYPAHFALTDVKNRRFFQTDLISREGPGLAGASTEDLHVHVRNWEARRDGGKIRITAKEREYALDLELVPEKPVTLHGNAGYSPKGGAENQASYYYSLTRLEARGHLIFQGIKHHVTGLAWMDHEFGSSILLKDQVGWDWFSLQLDDGTDLMVFRLRRKDGTFDPPFGSFVRADRGSSDLADRGISIEAKSTWTSPRTGASYPSGWTIEVPSERLNLDVSPLVEDQELVTGRSTGIAYWEGAVEVHGSRDGKRIRGKGYVELTGYAHSMAGRL
ncbi:MAG: carotenoid 1,2-hydratase [Desulfomonile tiedjei]|nr:carotenoid 1,2-hydratase [Desulfomonile tiedjei]